MTAGAAWLHTEVAVREAGVIVNVIPILLNTSVPPGKYQVLEEQDPLKAAAAFRSCDSEILELSPRIYVWKVGLSLCLSHKLSSDSQQKSSPEFSFCTKVL